MRSVLLSLDPPTLPTPVASLLDHAKFGVEQYGWPLLLTVIAIVITRHYLLAYLRRRASKLDPVHADEVSTKVREVRLAQQAAWQQTAPTLHKQTKEMSEEERALRRKYGEHKDHEPATGETLSYEEVFGDLDEGFYKGNKHKKKTFGSSSSSSSSGFKPYTRPAPSGGGGGGRRFGSGGPKRG